MPEWIKGKGFYGNQKINPEEYLDIVIRNIVTLPTELMQKEGNFDVNKYLRMLAILTEQLENLAVGMNKIKLPKKDYVVEELTENEKELREALVNYFKKEFPKLGIAVFSKADAVMRFVVEGNYKSKINLIQEDLLNEIKGQKIDEDIMNAQIANLKLQLIVRAIQNEKVKSVEINV